MPVEQGKAAPAFTLKDTDGNKFALKDQRGKSVVVYFYPKDDTPGCTKEAQGFRDLFKDFESRDVIIVGISPDDAESHDAFRCKYDLPFTLLCDPKKTVMTKYGAWGEKNMYGKIKVGVIRSTVLIGPDGKVIKRWARVPKAADHPAKVLEAVQAAADA